MVFRTSLAVPLLVLIGASGLRAGEPPRAGGLTLSIRVEPATVESGRPVHAVAVFRDDGPTPVRLHEPDHARLQAFPDWRWVRSDGATFAPTPWMGQSMWVKGIQGALQEIAPGASLAFEEDVPS